MPLVFHLKMGRKIIVRISGNGRICTLVKRRLYLYNLWHTAVKHCGGRQMENVKEFHNAEQQNNEADEAENFDVFIKAMVQAVEKYGRFVLQELDCVA